VTISDVFEASAALVEGKKGGRERGRAHVRTMVTEGDVAGLSRARRLVRAVAADLTSAWLWDAHGPSPRSMWRTRIPALEQVPGENTVLRAAWVAYNHVVLLALVPLMFAFWVLCHPARLLYAAPIAAPLSALWFV